MSRYKNVLVSVIVPAYNAEDSINRCLMSIDAQTLDNLEIIVVDDGSSDSTLAQAELFARGCSRPCRVFHKENGGPSSARNVGLDNARGMFVSFVDADDEVEPTAYEKMVNSALAFNSDIVTCGRSAYDCRTNELIKTRVPKYEVIRGSLTEAPQITKRVGPLMCDKLFRRSIIEDHHIRFAEDIFHAEDFLFISEVRLHVRCVSGVRESLYRYYQNSGVSISSGNARVLDIPEACKRVVDLYEATGVFDVTARHLLFVFMGYYLRKRRDLPRFSRLRRRFSKTFRNLFKEHFPQSWMRMLIRRSKQMYRDEGLGSLVKTL
ncbi:glycosyltransferase [uncultured Enorma sp.]|uniref:glycosyltransferase n=1 Tax=uncultured Enorma sp. TaxID=1714346 RepID=UPI002805B60B|nr:glycosyltransferase [uncultured Enorma sp.]